MAIFLNGSFLGASTFQKQQPVPTPVLYTGMNFNGQCIIDNIVFKNYVMNDSEINAINVLDDPAWDLQTIMLASFNNNTTDGGNITNLTSFLNTWSISRRESGSTSLTNLGTVDKSSVQFIDYLALSNKIYDYLIFPQTLNEIGNPLQISNVKTDFYGWYLIDITDGTTYMFDLNLQSQSIKHNTNMSIYENFTQFPTYSFSPLDYRNGSITCIAGSIDVDGTLMQSVDFINQLEGFINNKKEKILKDRKGNIMKVVTNNFSYKMMDDIREQACEITFDFNEAGVI